MPGSIFTYTRVLCDWEKVETGSCHLASYMCISLKSLLLCIRTYAVLKACLLGYVPAQSALDF